MPTFPLLSWLLIGLAFMLLVLLHHLRARRWQRARLSASHYRTASGRVIDQQSKAILLQPMATRRIRAGHIPPRAVPPPARPAGHTDIGHIRTRAAAAVAFDLRHGGTRRPGPFTAGTVEHQEWRRTYDAIDETQQAQARAVQTVAQQPAGASVAA